MHTSPASTGRFYPDRAEHAADFRHRRMKMQEDVGAAATATSKGVELDMDYLLGQALAGSWRLQTGLAWHHTRFDRFIDGSNDYSGKHNPYVPELNGHLGLRYETNPG